MKKSKLVTIGGIMLVLGLCGYFFLGASGKEKIGWETVKVMRGSMSNMVSATGTVEPVTKVDVGTQVSGIIDRIYVDYNSFIVYEKDRNILFCLGMHRQNVLRQCPPNRRMDRADRQNVDLWRS